MPHRRDATVNSRMHSMKNRLRPNAVASHPLIGSTMAFETRYDVNTQVLSSLLAPRSPAMCGSATLAMLVSSTSMNAASDTTTAISQGLTAGCGKTTGAEATLGRELIDLSNRETSAGRREAYVQNHLAAYVVLV